MLDIVKILAEKYYNDLIEFKKEFKKLPLISCSTGERDCSFLFLLVRECKPKNILEIGTFVGNTLFTIIKACELNGNEFIIHTIDDKNILKLDKSLLKNVIIHNGWSSKILKNINCQFDFIFSDAMLDEKTAKLLNKMINLNTFFATHDFVPPIDKGIISVYNILKYTKLKDNYLIMPSHLCNWIYLQKRSIHDEFSKQYLKNKKFEKYLTSHHDELDINSCVAIICPENFFITNKIEIKKKWMSDSLFSSHISNIKGIEKKVEKKKYYFDKEKNRIYIKAKNNKCIIVSQFLDDFPYLIGFISTKN